VSPDFRDRNGNTVLMVAAQNNRKRLVKACVRHGVPLDARNLKGNTAMHFAKAYGYEDVAEYLVRKGADPTIVNREGLRPDQGLTAATTKVGGDVATTHDDERTNA
jgi:ankyrin repeat protein